MEAVEEYLKSLKPQKRSGKVLSAKNSEIVKTLVEAHNGAQDALAAHAKAFEVASKCMGAMQSAHTQMAAQAEVHRSYAAKVDECVKSLATAGGLDDGLEEGGAASGQGGQTPTQSANGSRVGQSDAATQDPTAPQPAANKSATIEIPEFK